MIRFITGNLFTDSAQTRMCTVNCVGVMGTGIAKVFKQNDPAMYSAYAKACQTGQLHIGKCLIWKRSTPWVLLFPSKRHWRNDSRIEDVEAGLSYMRDNLVAMGVTSLAMTLPGCGLGNLNPSVVSKLVNQYLGQLPIEITVYVGGTR